MQGISPSSSITGLANSSTNKGEPPFFFMESSPTQFSFISNILLSSFVPSEACNNVVTDFPNTSLVFSYPSIFKKEELT